MNGTKFPAQRRIPATYMRGGTSKGVFFRLEDLPEAARVPGEARDKLCLHTIGSPDPYGKHTDGMGGATSSTSKIVIVAPATQPEHDVDYLFGQVAIDQPCVDWSGNCGNLAAAVGPFAIENGLVDAVKIPESGICEVRIWQANIGKTILNQVPITYSQVQETGDFTLDGVTFPAAEVVVDFMNPVDSDEALFPTGQLTDQLVVPGLGSFEATMITAGIPTIFVTADAMHCTGCELQQHINGNAEVLKKFATIRTHGALAMGLIEDPGEALPPHTPKIAFVAPPAAYIASSGKTIAASDIDLNVRALSMGQLHHAMMGTTAVAIATAAAIPGTLVNLATGGGQRDSVVFGHPSGTLRVGAAVVRHNARWVVERVRMSRSARVLMAGQVRIPDLPALHCT